MDSRVSLRIHGQVQGVFFRESARQEAVRLGLRGWVRNLSDGDVEVVAEGSRTPLDELVQWCHRGPPAARVTGVEARWGEAAGEFTGFSVERSS